MFKNATKTAVVAGGTLAVLGIAGVAYAATLSLQSNQLGAGTTSVAACAIGPGANAQTITASWVPNTAAGATTGVTDTAAGFTVKTVNVTGIPATCASTPTASKTVYVSVNDGTNVLGNGSLTIPANVTTTTPLTVTLINPANSTTAIPAASITGMNILIPN